MHFVASGIFDSCASVIDRQANRLTDGQNNLFFNCRCVAGVAYKTFLFFSLNSCQWMVIHYERNNVLGVENKMSIDLDSILPVLAGRVHYLVILAFTFRYRVVLQGHLLFVYHFTFLFPICTCYRNLPITCSLNILVSRVEICVTGELRSIINYWY